MYLTNTHLHGETPEIFLLSFDSVRWWANLRDLEQLQLDVF